MNTDSMVERAAAGTRPAEGTQAASQSMIAGGIAFAVGAMMIFAVGFSQTSAAHDAAHDTRHSLAFPCH